MRNLFSYCLSLLFVACFFLACDDNDDKGSKIERISIFQADYDYDGKEMVLRIKDNQSLQLIPLIFPSTVENKTLTYKNDNPSLMEVSTD